MSNQPASRAVATHASNANAHPGHIVMVTKHKRRTKDEMAVDAAQKKAESDKKEAKRNEGIARIASLEKNMAALEASGAKEGRRPQRTNKGATAQMIDDGDEGNASDEGFDMDLDFQPSHTATIDEETDCTDDTEQVVPPASKKAKTKKFPVRELIGKAKNKVLHMNSPGHQRD
jgi:hypothetical protein